MRKLSIVLPAYNEEENVEPFHGALAAVLDGPLSSYEAEVIYVDDGSRDATLDRLRALCDRDPRVRAVSLSRNFGHQAALTAGLEVATGDAVVTMDCDLQDPPELLPALVAKWEEGYRVVYARRAERADTLFKKWTAALYYRILDHVSEVRIPRQVGDYRLIDRLVADNLLHLVEHARYLRGMVAWLGFKHAFVDFDRPERLHGETHYPLRKMLRLAMDGLLSFSLLPLKLALWVGLVAIVSSAGFIAYMLYDHFVRNVPYMLYKWLIVTLFGFMGALFILIWILGEYIGRIYGDVRKRPLYIVDRRLGFGR